MELADKKICTACGACIYVCPKKCISFNANECGILYPEINHSLCVGCGKCTHTCPVLNPLASIEPAHAYAAWSSDVEERRTSASGGIAAEIYKYAIKKKWMIVGAAFDDGFEVRLALADDMKAIKDFKNSKYVFSNTDNIYQDIDKQLKSGTKIAIIALPCQIAAIKRVFHKYIDKLLLVDLVCHGTTPQLYLSQHIHHIENKYGEKASYLSFRDPYYSTDTFTFSLYNFSGHRFYSKRTKDRDGYQVGYHRMISYRENCYNCPFANEQRISDLTISDYKGLGVLAPSKIIDSKSISSVLVNTAKGHSIIKDMIKAGAVIAEERPVKEPIQGDEQLRHPAKKTTARKIFECSMLSCKGDFERAIHPVVIYVFGIEYLNKTLGAPKNIIRKTLHFLKWV